MVLDFGNANDCLKVLKEGAIAITQRLTVKRFKPSTSYMY